MNDKSIIFPLLYCARACDTFFHLPFKNLIWIDTRLVETCVEKTGFGTGLREVATWNRERRCFKTFFFQCKKFSV